MKYERNKKKAEEVDADLTFQPHINKDKYYRALEDKERREGAHLKTRDERIDDRLYPYHTARDPENGIEIQVSKKYMKSLDELPDDGSKVQAWRDFTKLDVESFRQRVAGEPLQYEYAAPSRSDAQQ